jgi:predicted polyphosphate/ATP-dependent NAD kinase
MSTKKLGVIVNPIAGMGGRVGLKGTDGEHTLKNAIQRGAVPVAPIRAMEALQQLSHLSKIIDLISYPHDMGENEAKRCGFHPRVIGSIAPNKTTSSDTKRAALDMAQLRVDLLLFAGGDGTARDVHESVGEETVALGIPAGVKIQSASFAVTPNAAGTLAAQFLSGKLSATRLAEVMDVDEDAFRANRIAAKLFGYLTIPYAPSMIQGAKEPTPADDRIEAEGIAADLTEDWQEDCIYILGPGSTTLILAEKFGVRKTLLGVDVLDGRELVASDANEEQLLQLIADRKKVKIVISLIGGQGFIVGRGNQQISPEVIRQVGKENLIVLATPDKLGGLEERVLLADSGDREVDRNLSGYIQVVTGYRRRSVCRVA